MKFDLEKVRYILYGDSLFIKWCALNYIKDLYRKTGAFKEEWEYLSSFYPEEEYIYDYFLKFETHRGKDTLITFVKHITFDRYLPIYEAFDPNKKYNIEPDNPTAYLYEMTFEEDFTSRPFYPEKKSFVIKESRQEKDASCIFYESGDTFMCCIPRKDNFYLNKENQVLPFSHNAPWASYYNYHNTEEYVDIRIH